MRSASSADRSAICVTFNLPRENAVELHNLARSCAGRLRELGVLALQVGNSTAISLQPGSVCQSVNHGGTRDHRQQNLNATRTNIARYLGAAISTVPPVSCSGNTTLPQNSIHEHDAGAMASMSTGVPVEQPMNMVAESSPHIVNLLQHDALSGSGCLSSPVPMSSASDVRPRKRARRRAASTATDTSVPSTMHGTADYANSVYSSQPALQCAEYSADVPATQYVEQFKVPVSRRRKPCSSRKGAVSKDQRVTGQALTASFANSFDAGFSEAGKISEVDMFQAASPCNLGDGFQMNGISPYHRIPVMSPGWQPFAARSAPSNGLYQFPPATAPYPNEYGHHRLRFSSNISYSQVPANASRAPDLDSYRSIAPGSPGMFAANTNQMYLKEELHHSVVPQKPLQWLPPTESQPESAMFGSGGSVMHQARQVHNVAQDRSHCLSTSNVMQRSFVAHQPDMLLVPNDSKQCTGTVVSASQKVVSADIERLKVASMSVCGAVKTNCVTCVTGEHVSMQPSLTCQRANGLLTDVHSAALALRENPGDVKVNGEVDCVQQVVRQPLLTSSAVTESPYACLASSTTANVVDRNCFPERQLQQASVQLPMKTQQFGGMDFDLNGSSAVPDTLQSSVLPGADSGVARLGQQCYATQDDASS